MNRPVAPFEESSAPAGGRAPRFRALLNRWPTLLGLAAAAQVIVTGAGVDSAAIVVLVATVCYLAAAATGRPWVGWAALPGAVILVVAGEVLGLETWVTLGAAAAALLVVGLVLAVNRTVLGAEAAGVLLYGGVATVALFLPSTAGMLVVGATLALHALWDAAHLWRRAVVPGSLAEFCIFLDVPVGATLIVLALWG